MLHVLLLLTCAAVIYVACEWFVNAVEWLGVRLKIGRLAVGTLLAAAGTALPESVVTLVAVVAGTESGDEIGIGAALGGPLVVGTLAYGLTGALLLLRGRRDRAAARASASAPASAPQHPDGPAGGDLPLAQRDATAQPVRRPLDGTDTSRLARDQAWFAAIFVVKVAVGLVAFAWKPWLALLFVAAYAVYFASELRGGSEQASGEGLEPLKLQPRRADPSLAGVLVQTVTTLAVIFVASRVFVGQLEWAGPALGLSPVVVALLLAPVATELPELLNAAIWVRQGKAQLALANISGAMMIQATIPSAIGLAFTPWLFDAPLLLAGVATLASVVYLRQMMLSARPGAGRLVGAAGFYLAFAVGLAFVVS